MKFGKQLLEQITQFDQQFRECFIDYNDLKHYLKENIKELVIDDTLQAQIAEASKSTDEFVRRLDANVKRVNDFFLRETAGDQMDKFLFLNYTALTKILKKHDKLQVASITKPYLKHLEQFEFFGPVVSQQPPVKSEGSSQNLQVSLKSDKLVITLSGPHGTDIVGSLLDCLNKYSVVLEDLKISRLFHRVSCTALVQIKHDNISLFKELNQAAERWQGELVFEVFDGVPVSMEEAPYSGRVKYLATVLNTQGLSVEFLAEFTHVLLKFKISLESLKRLSDGKLTVMEMRLSVPIDVSLDIFRSEVFQLGSRTNTDIALQPDDVYRRSKRLVVLDMDSTLIQQEVIDELARHAGVVDQVSAITHRAMNGEIDFKESLRQRVALLKGTPISVLETVRRSLVFTEGARQLCRALKRIGFKLAVISGGFLPLANYVKSELGLDYAFANQLKVNGDVLVGETTGSIVDAERKAELLEVIAQAESISRSQVIAVGDGANDLMMLGAADLGIAFNAKPTVQARAKTRLNQKSLINVLYLLGYSEADIKALVEE